MQTFLPYSSFEESARILDYRRLGKQRVEAWQILRSLDGITKGWSNHPAVRQWLGYEGALAEYGRVMCKEWINRGYRDSMLERFPNLPIVIPPWLGDARLHISHMSNLVRKDPGYYRKYFPEIDETIPYFWVIHQEIYYK